VCVSNETKAIEYLTVEVDEPVGDGGVRQLTDVDLRPVEHLAVERAACYRLVEIENLDHVLTCIRCTTKTAGATALRDPWDAYAPTLETMGTNCISSLQLLQLAVIFRWALWVADSASPDLLAKFKGRGKEVYGREGNG